MSAPSRHRGSRRAGFTLVEILVVMGIVAVLAVLSTTAIRSSLARARNSGCIANLHQIYVSLQQYASDNDEQVPVMLPLRTLSTDPGPTLDTVLTPYLSDPKAFHCPADGALFARSGSSYLWVYGMSVNSEGEQNKSMVSINFPLFQNANPSQIPFVSDKQSFHPTTPGAHIVYADGHVE